MKTDQEKLNKLEAEEKNVEELERIRCVEALYLKKIVWINIIES